MMWYARSWNSSRKRLRGILAFVTTFAILTLASVAHAQDPTGVTAKNTRRETFEFGKFGAVQIYIPTAGIKQVAIFADGDGGWNDGINDMAQLLANEGTLVAGVDTVPYLNKLSAATEKCGYMAADFEDLAHAVEKKYAMKSYLLPVLAGYSSGASLVYAALAQAPKGTFKGALTLGFCDDLADTHAICKGRGLATKLKPKKDGSLLLPMKDLSEPWTALQGRSDQACSLESLNTFTKDITSAKVVPLDKVGHGFQVGKRWHSQYVAAHKDLQKTAIALAPLPTEVGDLPLVEVPAAANARGTRSDLLAILITGDGGWAGLDQDVAAGLAAANIPVVALSSLKYFWEEHPPATAAKDLTRIIGHYTQQWHRDRVLLVGYSFGANVLPAVVGELSDSARSHVDRVALIGLEPKAAFEIHVTGWLGQVSGERPVLPDIQRVAKLEIPLVCVRGQEEADSFCPSIPADLARSVVLPGGHHFNGDYDALVKAILADSQ